MTAPPVPLVAGSGLELYPSVVIAFPAGDPHLLHEGEGDHLLDQHTHYGGESVHVASTTVFCKVSK